MQIRSDGVRLGVFLWLLTACSGAAGGPDASTDATTQPSGPFSMQVDPSHVTADSGDPSININIFIDRSPSFLDDVAFTVDNAIAGVTNTSPADTGTGPSAVHSVFALTVGATAIDGDYSFSITARSGMFTQSATVGLRVGSLLVPDDAGVYVVPTYASVLQATAWGAGGGGGSNCYACSNGLGANGSGGGSGGFATTTFPVTPFSKLFTVVGTGGGPGVVFCGEWGGGGGGGFTGLKLENGTYVLIAGGGGGGAAGAYNDLGGPGGGESGLLGTGTCGGLGGTQTNGGAATCTSGTPGAPIREATVSATDATRALRGDRPAAAAAASSRGRFPIIRKGPGAGAADTSAALVAVCSMAAVAVVVVAGVGGFSMRACSPRGTA